MGDPVFTGAGSSSTTGCRYPCNSNWESWPTATSLSAASTSWPSDCPAQGKHTHCAPWATGSWSRADQCYSPRPTGWCRTCWPPSGISRCRVNCGSWTTSTSCSWTTWDTCPQGAEESEVLFTLIAERYERRSLGITPNLVFSEWERIFATPAAIDRVVHHSVILEFDVPSYRTDAAQQRGQDRGEDKEVNRQECLMRDT